MRIRSIKADNFKSLVDFQLDLAKFSCLIGLNGVGKSTVLQFIDFLAQQVRGGLRGWLDERHWEANEVLSLTTSKTVTFRVTVLDQQRRETVWSGAFNPYRLQCTSESLKTPDAELKLQSASYSIKERGKPTNKQRVAGKIPFTYEGSILSQLREEVLPESLHQFKDFFLKTESLDMLTPERLRERTRSADGSLGRGGGHLSAFVFELGLRGRKALAKRLKGAYEHLEHVHAKSGKRGWKQLQVSERFEDVNLWTEARHINDGMLRQIAILAELASEHEFLLVDEIENGINPELVEFVIDALTKARQQVMVTTHSPMILNYLEDDVAKAGVIYLYKTKAGHTRSIPFFTIPSVAEKLTVMGPGEAFVDTNLTALGEEIRALTAGADMYLLFSGEGATDLGTGSGAASVCEGEHFVLGPMALIADQVVEAELDYSVLEVGSCGIVSEHHLAQRSAELKAVKKALRLPGEKQSKEIRYFFNNARILARIAKQKEAERQQEDVVAVLFRDSDGTASAGRGLWEDKRQSMLDGFDQERFARGVAMIPKPKSEAWVLCALKRNPYRRCEALEDRSGNDDSPNALKKELAEILGGADVRESLCERLRNGKIDIERIQMPSFAAFRSRLKEVL